MWVFFKNGSGLWIVTYTSAQNALQSLEKKNMDNALKISGRDNFKLNIVYDLYR